MRQTAMGRWIEAAEAKRVCQIAQLRPLPIESMPPPNALVTKLRSMMRPQISHACAARGEVTRPAA